jgi:hypothetical protein
MDHSRPSTPLWLLCAALLLSAGFLATVYVAALLAVAGAGEGSVRSTQAALVLYARVVLAKGLLPHVVLTVLGAALLERRKGGGVRGARLSAAGLVGVAALASLLAAASLTADLPGLPPVKFAGAASFLRTCAELTAATSVAALLSRLVLARLRRG